VDVAVGENHTLGLAGGAPGGEDSEVIIQFTALALEGFRCPKGPLFQADAGTAIVVDADDLTNTWTLFLQLTGLFSIGAMKQQQVAIKTLQQVGVNWHRVARVDRQPHTLCPEQAQQGQEGNSAVGRQYSHVSAPAVTVVVQGACDLMGDWLGLGIGHVRLVATHVHEGDVFRVEPYRAVEMFDDSHVVLILVD
jgi:hypothetical protein